MTSIRILGLLGLLGGLAIGLTRDAPGHERKPKHLLGTMSVFDGKDYFGNVIRDGDRFVGDRNQRPDNYESMFSDNIVVDGKYLGYDLRGKNKNVLVREESGDDTSWTFVSSEAKSPFSGYLRVKNGDLKGWWIGLGPVEPAKKGEELPRNRRGPRAPLILVKDKKDAAGEDSYTPEKDDDNR